MNNPYIYYKEQCKYCIKNGKCNYQKKTQTFIDAINGFERLTNGVYGSLSFKCDYFDFDHLAYNKNNPPETCG